MKTALEFIQEHETMKRNIIETIRKMVDNFTKHYAVVEVDLAEFDAKIEYEYDENRGYNHITTLDDYVHIYDCDEEVYCKEYKDLTMDMLISIRQALDKLYDMHKGELPVIPE